MATTTVTMTRTVGMKLPSETQALVLHAPEDLRLETHPLFPPAPEDLQISILRTGLCGSDCHYYSHGRNGSFMMQEPLVLGHEAAGVVTAVGGAVTGFKVGDRVAIEVGVACGRCDYCQPASSRGMKGMRPSAHRRNTMDTVSSNGMDGHHYTKMAQNFQSIGEKTRYQTFAGANGATRNTPKPTTKAAAPRYNLCSNMQFRSSAKTFPHFQGTLTTYLNHPAQWCHILPSNVSLDLGAILEPLSVALHASKRAQLTGNETVLVLGAGAVGLLCAWVARKRYAKRIVIADIDPRRVQWAIEKGYADYGVTVSPKRGATTEDQLDIAQANARRFVSENTYSSDFKGEDDPGPDEFDVTFECTGTETCVQSAIYSTCPGGKVLLVGMGTPIQTLPLGAAALREVDLLGVFRYAHTYKEGIEMMSEREPGIPDLKDLVSHRLRGVEGARKGFEMLGKGKGRDEKGRLVLKVMVDLGDDTRN